VAAIVPPWIPIFGQILQVIDFATQSVDMFERIWDFPVFFYEGFPFKEVVGSSTVPMCLHALEDVQRVDS